MLRFGYTSREIVTAVSENDTKHRNCADGVQNFAYALLTNSQCYLPAHVSNSVTLVSMNCHNCKHFHLQNLFARSDTFQFEVLYSTLCPTVLSDFQNFQITNKS
jgi:hypothetical protein